VFILFGCGYAALGSLCQNPSFSSRPAQISNIFIPPP